MATALVARESTEIQHLGATSKQIEFLKQLAPYAPQLMAVVPRAVTMQHYVTLLLREAVRSPKILNCTPDSVYTALSEVARLRLEIGHTVYLIPRDVRNRNGDVIRTELREQVGYKGHVELMLRSKHVRDVWAEVVYKTDAFVFNRADRRVTQHERLGRGTPADVIGAYAVVLLPHGLRRDEYLDRDEIEARRARSAQPDGELWTKFYVEACKKTAVLAIQKYLPHSAEEARPREEDETPAYLFESTPLAATGTHPYGDEVTGPARQLGATRSTPEVRDATAHAESVEAHVQSAPSAPHDDDALVTSDGEAVAEGEEPACPKCGGPVWDNRATKTNPRAPDFKCRNAPKTRGGPGCDGVIWPAREG